MNTMQYKDVNQIANELGTLAQYKERPIVTVMGLSGAGKSYTSKQLEQVLNHACVVSFDWWIREPSSVRRALIASAYEENGTMPDPLSWYDWEAFETSLHVLQTTGSLTLVGMWNQQTGEKDLDLNLHVPNDGIVIVEGMYLMEYGVRQFVDYSIVIDTNPTAAIMASTSRRSQQSSSTYQTVKARWIREYDVPYIARYIQTADAVINNIDHPHSQH